MQLLLLFFFYFGSDTKREILQCPQQWLSLLCLWKILLLLLLWVKRWYAVRFGNVYEKLFPSSPSLWKNPLKSDRNTGVYYLFTSTDFHETLGELLANTRRRGQHLRLLHTLQRYLRQTGRELCSWTVDRSQCSSHLGSLSLWRGWSVS